MGNQITTQEATDLCDNFDDKYKELCKVKADDNRSTYFTIEELKTYLNFLENSEEDVEGVRIYLGSYGPNEDSKSNLTTVFLAPVKSNGKDNLKINAYNYGEPGSPPSKKYGK